MTEHYEMPHRFADHCPHAGVGKACAPCRRAFGEVYRLAHLDFQAELQSSIDEAAREVQERVWAECSQWHAEQGMPVKGAADEHNPYTIENQENQQ